MQHRAHNSLFYRASLGRGCTGGPQCAGLGPRALSQPGSLQQLGDRFQGDAGSRVHGGLARQQLMGNRCEAALWRSGPGGAGARTSLPAPVALPLPAPGALAGPCAAWGEEPGRRQPPTRLPHKAGQRLFQKNNLSDRYFTYINIHLCGYVQMQQEPVRQWGSCPDTSTEVLAKACLPGRCHGHPVQCPPWRGSGSRCPAMPGRSQPGLKAQCRNGARNTMPWHCVSGPCPPTAHTMQSREPGPAPCKGRGSLGITLPCPPSSPHTGVEEARSQWQRIVGEDGIVRGARASGVLAGGRVLFEGHGEVQVLQGEMLLSAPTLPPLLPTRPHTAHLLRNSRQDLVQPLHKLLEGGTL